MELDELDQDLDSPDEGEAGSSTASDSGTSETITGATATGDSTTSDTAAGDTATGDTATGDTATGEDTIGGTATGNTAIGEDTTGNATTGDSATGGSATGGTVTGNTTTGNVTIGESTTGGTAADNGGRDNNVSTDGGTNQSEAGDTAFGGSETGDTGIGETAVGDGASGNETGGSQDELDEAGDTAFGGGDTGDNVVGETAVGDGTSGNEASESQGGVEEAEDDEIEPGEGGPFPPMPMSLDTGENLQNMTDSIPPGSATALPSSPINSSVPVSSSATAPETTPFATSSDCDWTTSVPFANRTSSETEPGYGAFSFTPAVSTSSGIVPVESMRSMSAGNKSDIAVPTAAVISDDTASASSVPNANIANIALDGVGSTGEGSDIGSGGGGGGGESEGQSDLRDRLWSQLVCLQHVLSARVTLSSFSPFTPPETSPLTHIHIHTHTHTHTYLGDRLFLYTQLSSIPPSPLQTPYSNQSINQSINQCSTQSNRKTSTQIQIQKARLLTTNRLETRCFSYHTVRLGILLLVVARVK